MLSVPCGKSYFCKWHQLSSILLLLFTEDFSPEQEQIKDNENDHQNSKGDEGLGEALRCEADQKQHREA